MSKQKPLALLISPQNYNSIHENGQSIRVESIGKLLESAGYEVLTIHVGRFAIYKVMRLISKRRPTILCAVSFIMFPALFGASLQGTPIWLDFMDSAVLTRLNGSLLRKLYFKLIEQPCIKLISQKALICSHISELDQTSDASFLHKKSFVIPNFLGSSPTPYTQVEPVRFVLIGDLNYRQNVESARKLVKIREKIGFKVQFYGNSRKTSIQRELGNRYAESLMEMYQIGDIHFCLSTSSAGIKNKVVNALLHGIPVISTVAGANGISTSPGLLVLSSDIPIEDQVQHIVNNLQITDREILWRGFKIDDSEKLVNVLAELKS